MYRRSGFTIVEIVVVIAVISILATIATVSYVGLQVRSRDDERLADVETMKVALENFYEQRGRYPALTASELANVPTFYDATLRIPPAGLKAPSGSAFSWVWNTTPTTSTYSLATYENVGGTLCTSTQPCTRYVIRWYSEADSAVRTVTSKFGN